MLGLMRRVLVLSYFHPPIGGAGALRTLTLLRRLPSLGYEPVVVTGPGETSGASARTIRA